MCLRMMADSLLLALKCKMKLVQLRMSGLSPTYDVAAANSLPLLPAHDAMLFIDAFMQF
jgi:hypothetical protein